VSATVRSLAANQRVLGALSDGPKTANEIADVLLLEVWQAWADRHGYDLAALIENEVEVRVMAWAEAEENGLAYLFSHQVYPRLRALERKGLVERVQIAGTRPMLWRLA